MDMDQAAVFLAGTILTALGFIVVLIAIVLANNIIHRWWKPLGWNFGWISTPTRFATPEELEQPPKIEPRIDNKNEPKAKTN
jgi:hypothetical protein